MRRNLQLSGSEFDLDIVFHIKEVYTKFTPNQIYYELVKLLENDDRYKDKIEKKKRCVRLNYANDFHMDIMPGCIKFNSSGSSIKVPDRELKNWVNSNPKGFIDWFLTKARLSTPTLLEQYRNTLIESKAEVEDLPNDDFYNKTPLQRSVQLIKRCRDMFFEKDDAYATSSIVLTTLMGHFYAGEISIYDTLEQVISRIKNSYQESVNKRFKFKILNPSNSEEDFTDKWTDQHYIHFVAFIDDFYKKWNSLKQNFEKSAIDYIRLFGEGIYKQSLQDQVRQMSKYSRQPTVVANGLILTGKAYTDAKGQINANVGYRNEPHRNYGE
jgi:hypothetical protein